MTRPFEVPGFHGNPLVNILLKMAIEIVELAINSMVIFHSDVNVYQDGYPKPWLFHAFPSNNEQ